MKKFTINCDFNGQMSPFTIYLGTPESTHHPLHFQSDWLGKQKGGSIPSPIMEAISKLQALANKNQVSFEELCVYCLGSFDLDNNANTDSNDEDLESDDADSEDDDADSEDDDADSEDDDADSEDDDDDSEDDDDD